MDTFAFFDGVFFDVDIVVAEITAVIMVLVIMVVFPPFLFVLACRRQKCNDWCLGLVCKRN